MKKSEFYMSPTLKVIIPVKNFCLKVKSTESKVMKIRATHTEKGFGLEVDVTGYI
jgi:hypothetical protein